MIKLTRKDKFAFEKFYNYFFHTSVFRKDGQIKSAKHVRRALLVFKQTGGDTNKVTPELLDLMNGV